MAHIIPCVLCGFVLCLCGTVADAGGERPGGSNDRRIPTRSDYTDGTVWDGEPPQQVCVHASWGFSCLSAILLSAHVKELLTSIPSHRRFREALVESGKEHRRDPSNNKNKFYLHYLLASISNCIILKWDHGWVVVNDHWQSFQSFIAQMFGLILETLGAQNRLISCLHHKHCGNICGNCLKRNQFIL